MKSTKKEWLSVIPYLSIPIFVGLVAYTPDIYHHFFKKDLKSFDNFNSSANSNSTVDVSSLGSVANYLTSKKFRSINNMSIKFYPEGYYELSHNYQVAMTGKWTVGNGGVLLLESEEGNLNMTLSSDGTITDNASSRVFQ